MRTRALAATAVVSCALAASIAAHIRLHAFGIPLFWPTPANVSIVINAAGSENLSDDSHFTALRNGFDAWNGAPGSSIQLVEDPTPAQQQRTDWMATDIHLILFDENNSSGFFPFGSSTVALTPVLFYVWGAIVDADILFNGSGFDFTTSGQLGFFDIQDVGTHELGHFLGLDHTGSAGATMYPFVSANMILRRSLGLDDAGGMRDAYPVGAQGTIVGTVKRMSGNTVVAGAFVVARDPSGYTAASALADNGGVFRLEGLLPGTYTVYATPLDFPVGVANLQPGHTVQTDFRSSLGATLAVGAGQTIAHGDLLVGADAMLALGKGGIPPPLRAVQGVPTGIAALFGMNLAGVSLTASDPTVAVNVIGSTSNSVTFTVAAAAGAAPGHVDLVATNGGELSILPAAIEITPPNPTVTNVAPPSGLVTGGTAVTITGTGFRPGARVVIGQGIYVDGAAATVVDPNTITLTTVPTAAGTYHVVVIDATGVEGRTDGFTFVGPGPTPVTLFCTAKTMLICGPANISATGTSSATASSGFVIEAQPVRGCRAGLLLYTDQPPVQPATSFGGPGNGVLCISWGLRRAGPIESGGTSPQVCDGSMRIDMNAFNTSNWMTSGCNPTASQTNPAGFLSNMGTTVNAQMWGRDSIATGQVLSDGISWVVGP